MEQLILKKRDTAQSQDLFFIKKKIENYSFFGGLSEVWKGVVAATTKSDLNNLFLNNKEKLLNDVLDLIRDYMS